MLTWLLMVLAGIAVVVGSWLVYVYHDGNFAEVVPGELYRSAQLSDKDLTRQIATNGIRSVLNLRGAEPKSEWYVAERDAALAAGVKHYDLRLASRKELSLKQFQDLMDIMENAPKPLLIHCHRGADRTGLAAALYLRHIERRPLEEAASQLSLRYGHFPWLGSKTAAMERSLYAAEEPPVRYQY